MIQFFLILHLIGDFYLQFAKIAHCKVGLLDDTCVNCTRCKDEKLVNFKFLLLHVLLYGVPFAMIFHFAKWYYAIAIIIFLVLTHFAVDFITCLLKKYKKIPSSVIFVVDQALHIVSLFGAYHLFNYCISTNNFVTNNIKIVNIILFILILITPSMQFIKCVLNDFFEEENINENKGNKIKNKFDSGKLIGVIERLLVLVFFYLEAYPTIAIIITLKTWARSNEIKEKPGFGNKYLVGTLLSFLIAAICGIGILKLVK